MNKLFNGGLKPTLRTVTGGKWNKITKKYVSSTAGVTYEWNGRNGSDLVIKYGNNDKVTVKNFNNGDLNITFDKSDKAPLTDPSSGSGAGSAASFMCMFEDAPFVDSFNYHKKVYLNVA